MKLLNYAGEPWNNDEELKHHIPKKCEEFTICQVYQKPPPRSVVRLPLASSFQECVAIDLKFYHNKILLNLVDHATQLSATTFIPSKDPDTIIKAIFSCWIQIYRSAEKSLTGNGGEFTNSKFLEMF